jgi:hypothetical protein
MNSAQRTKEFVVIALGCAFAIWGAQFLPSEDYWPSRFIYSACWFAAAIILFLAVRTQQGWLRSAASWLVGIFAFGVLISFVM